MANPACPLTRYLAARPDHLANIYGPDTVSRTSHRRATWLKALPGHVWQSRQWHA